MKHSYNWDADIPQWFIKACIASLTKHAANTAREYPADPLIEDSRITVEQLASYYALCGIGKGAANREQLEFIQPFDEKIRQARSGNFCAALTQNEIEDGVRGLCQYIYEMDCEGEDAYIPDISRCQKLIGSLEELQQQGQSMGMPSL
jgi:hypothetical protein